MRFSAFAILALPLAVLATPTPAVDAAVDTFEEFEKRSAASVLKDLSTVLSDVNSLQKTLDSFGNNDKPSFSQLITLQNTGKKLEKDLDAAISEAKKSGRFTVAQSNKGYTFLAKKLYPATDKLLKSFIAHYPGLKKGGVVKLVHDTLVAGEGKVKTLSKELIKKSRGSAVKKGAALEKKFIAAFNAAIKKYSS